MSTRPYSGPYSGQNLNQVAFPIGGIGAGMYCLEGTGTLSHMSVRHKPDVFNKPGIFGALYIEGVENGARIIEGPVPEWKYFGPQRTGNGGSFLTGYGLPRFENCTFTARFPFACVKLRDDALPIAVNLTGFSPFIPNHADDASLPVGSIEYELRNTSEKKQKGVLSFHSRNFMADAMLKDQQRVLAIENGFVLQADPVEGKEHLEGKFAVLCDAADTHVDCRMFRGEKFDPLTVVWKHIANGDVIDNPPFVPDDPFPATGGSIYIPYELGPGASTTIRIHTIWFVPTSEVRVGKDKEPSCGSGCDCAEKVPSKETYTPWYKKRFGTIDKVIAYYLGNYQRLRMESALFCDAFFDSTLPPEVIEAASANLSILKSPTVLRDEEGRFWGYEGCADDMGCCFGSCTHVWNYAQAMAHLLPSLERTMRDTEFGFAQDERGHQHFRASLPMRPADHGFYAAADGQLGGIMKVYRDYRIGNDKEWLRSIWPKVKRSLEYCMETWDPDRIGLVVEPHHNTYDIEFWGPDGMCSSIYCGALKAASLLAGVLEDPAAESYEKLYQTSKAAIEEQLFDGEYFIQKIRWKDLKAANPAKNSLQGTQYSSEAVKLLEKEGPKYQYGSGCLSDGVLGVWLAEMAGLPDILDRDKVASHLKAVFRYNFKKDLTLHANPQRWSYALGKEGGLLLCTWPKGGALTLPFAYSDEVWTGIEYQVASHLILLGMVEEGVEIVRTVRDRHDGRIRNPFNEYECGHWYARALSSYGVMTAMAGIRYDAVAKTLYVRPAVKGDFRSFISTATGFGTAGVRDGKPFLEVAYGEIEVGKIIGPG